MGWRHDLLASLSPGRYEDRDGTVYVRHAFRDWEPLTPHILRDHPEMAVRLGLVGRQKQPVKK